MPEPAARQRFVDGFAAQVGLEPARLDQPGTTVVGRADRVGTALAVGYRIGRHAVIWCDPAIADRLRHLVDDRHTIDGPALASVAAGAGFEPVAVAAMRLLRHDHPGLVGTEALLDKAYHHRRLRADQPHDVDLVRSFVDRCDPADVEEAALDDLDDVVDETAIHVLVHGHDDHLVAYASASPWDWDPTFGDIGVLVDAAHRHRGLGRFVVIETCAELLADGRLPLYRHDRTNRGSAAIATSLGFETVAELDAYRAAGPTDGGSATVAE